MPDRCPWRVTRVRVRVGTGEQAETRVPVRGLDPEIRAQVQLGSSCAIESIGNGRWLSYAKKRQKLAQRTM